MTAAQLTALQESMTLQTKIDAACREIGALEFNHREAMRPRYERLAHMSRELNELTGANK